MLSKDFNFFSFAAKRAFSTVSTINKSIGGRPGPQNNDSPHRRSTLVGAPVHRRIYKAATLQGPKFDQFPLVRGGPRAADQSNAISSASNISSFGGEATAPNQISKAGKATDAQHVIFNLAYDRDEKLIRILWGDGHQSTFYLIWLRDEDRSPTCFDAATSQRLTESGSIPLDIGANSIEVMEGGRRLRIEWDTPVMGVTHSEYDTPFLRFHCYAAARLNNGVRGGAPPPTVCTWGRELSSILPTLSVPYAEVMADGDAGERAVLQLLDMVRLYGVGFISGTPHCKAASQRAVERIAPIRHTLYGGFWETKVLPPDDEENVDSAYSTVPLPAHTDGNYLEDPPGLQVFHCLQADPTGGDTLLVDGFRVGEALLAADPASFALLASVPVTYRHADPRHRLEARHRTFGLDPDTGRLARFHYNNLDRAPLHAPPGDVPAFYRAWAALAAAVADPAGEVWCKLRPGDLVVIDNRRVMHGRSRVSAHSGRVLVGCYVTYEDYLSRLRVLRARFAAGAAPARVPAWEGQPP